MPEAVFLEVRSLSKTYPGGWGIHAIDLDLPAGVVAALGGPNGSGKSTLLRCLAGVAAGSGQVRLEGRSLDGDHDVRRRIGYLPQAVAFPAQASIGEIVDLFARLRGVQPHDHPLPADFIPPWDAIVGTLSGGQRHRVALAVAMLGSPSLLLLDEPMASLDEEGRGVFWDVVHGLRSDGVTTIVSSPAPSELRGVADLALHMVDGRLTEVEPLGALHDAGRRASVPREATS